MPHNLLNAKTAAVVIQRVQRLSADVAPLWGSMTATEMLRHCNLVHQNLLEAPAKPAKPTTLKQYVIRTVVLYLLPHYPKGAKAPARLITKGAVGNENFKSEKAAFISWTQKFAVHTAPITAGHPYFGALNTKQWGRTSYKHIDHHLRQFGL